MALAIRLSRAGSKKRPYYRIVVTDSRSPRDGRFIEKVGTYNPLLAKDSAERVNLDSDRIGHWLSVGAQPSDRVLRFLDAAGIRERVARNNPKKAEPGDKAKERVEARAAKEAEAAQAAEAAAAEPEEAEAVVADEVEAATAEPTPVADEVEAASAEPAPAAEEAAEETPAADNQGEASAEPAEGADDVPPPSAESPQPAETPAEGEASEEAAVDEKA